MEEVTDTANASIYKDDKQTLGQKIHSLQSALFAENLVYVAHQVLHAGANRKLLDAEQNVRKLEEKINTIQTNHAHTHQHQHTNRADRLHNELASAKSRVNDLRTEERLEYAIYLQHETNKQRIQSEITSTQSAINSLSKLQADLKVRENARTQRHVARTQANDECLPKEALSDKISYQLNCDIQSAQNKVNSTCAQMKVMANTRCYPEFLNQLNRQVDTLLLHENQKTALKQITAKMQEHLRDVHFREQQAIELTRLRTELQRNQNDRDTKQSECGQLILRNQMLVNENELLGSEISSLTSRHEKLLERRDFYAQCSLAGLGIVGVGSITAYFLIQAGVIALVPGVNVIVAAVAGVALMGLLVATGVTALQAYFKQSEITTATQTFNNNASEIERNNSTMSQTQENDLPNLVIQIASLKQQVLVQTEKTNEAARTADASIDEARKITVNTPTAGNNQNGFFTQASAPMTSVSSAQNPGYQP